jgi:hypothetical protein
MPSALFILPLSLTHSERKEYSDLSRLVVIVLIEKQNKKKALMQLILLITDIINQFLVLYLRNLIFNYICIILV